MKKWRYINTDEDLEKAIKEAFDNWISGHRRDIPYGLGEAGKQSVTHYLKKYFTVADV